jgi:hypothetical protein
VKPKTKREPAKVYGRGAAKPESKRGPSFVFSADLQEAAYSLWGKSNETAITRAMSDKQTRGLGQLKAKGFPAPAALENVAETQPLALTRQSAAPDPRKGPAQRIESWGPGSRAGQAEPSAAATPKPPAPPPLAAERTAAAPVDQPVPERRAAERR